ncbi:hypothetical protein Trisim1_011088 [Trichoderma cf. simile WF8]
MNGLEDFPQIRLDPDNDNDINEDIKRFIYSAMQELSRRSGYDDNFLRDIENILLRRSKGTFLWIGFVMKELLDMSTRMEIMDVLNGLPQGLPAMYGRMLRQIKSSQRHIISTILTCVTIARRPMILEELRTAVSLLCNTPIDSTPMMRDRIASCGPILQISSEGLDTCSLVHQSARDYLLREEVDNDPILEEFRIKVKEAHASLARICLACIENSDFRHEPLDITDASALKKSPLLGYATKHWPEHARHADEDLDSSETFFQKKNDVWNHWWRTYRKDIGWDADEAGNQPLHIASYLGIVSLARKILHANAWHISLKFQRYVNWTNERGRTPLMVAAHEGHHDVVQLLLANGADVNVISKSGGGWKRSSTALEAAAMRGHLSVVQLLLANGADPKLPGNDWALLQAAENGHAAVVQLLLTKGADINKKVPTISVGTSVPVWYPYQTALRLAARKAHEDLVRLLLANGADVDTKDDKGDTELHEATSNGYEAIVRLLLVNGADVNIKGSRSNSTPLQEAAREGREALVRLLIANGADVNLKGSYGRTALHEASRISHKATIRLLSANRADSEDDMDAFNKVLAAAARDGRDAIVRLLLTNGADVNITDRNGQTALRNAAMIGHEAVVRLLLCNGADVTIRDKYGRTALYGAASNGHEDIVQLLLENGALDSKTDAFSRALAVAAWGGDKATVRLLLAKSAHADIKDSMSTALIRAAERGREQILQILLENGADINGRQLHPGHDIWYTALEMAAVKGRTTTVQFLLANGARNVSTKNTEEPSRTALDWAVQKEHEDIVQLLLADGVSDVDVKNALMLSLSVRHNAITQMLTLRTYSKSKADIPRF